jgi:hypothetical protein
LKKLLPYLIALPLAAFGLLTLFLSTSIIFDWFGIRAKEGNYVLFVVWANFICSLLYLFAAYGFIKVKKWTFLVLGLATIVLISTFIIFKIYIYSGGIYETKTVGALIFRTIATLIFVFLAYFTIAKKYKTIKAN